MFKMLWPGFEPGLLWPQRNVITTTLPQLIFEGSARRVTKGFISCGSRMRSKENRV